MFPVADNFKVQYMQLLSYMKTPQYHTNLQQALEQERVGTPDFSRSYLQTRIYYFFYCELDTF